MNLPPWLAMVQAHADQAEQDPRRKAAETLRSLSRDITNSVAEDVLGPRPARHRKEPA